MPGPAKPRTAPTPEVERDWPFDRHLVLLAPSCYPAFVDFIVVSSLSELVAEVVSLGRRAKGALWFRGHSDASYSLLPGLLRDGKDLTAVEERETRLLTRFQQRSPPFLQDPRTTGSDWNLLFAMQHYGVPTRLLDWSENLFVAAYFALMSESEKDAVVWCLDPVGWNRTCPHLKTYGTDIHVLNTVDEDLDAYRPQTDPKLKRRISSVVAMFGSHNSSRIVAQSGAFTIWGKTTKPMETLASERGETLWPFKLQGSRQRMFEELNLLGFRETMLFPELSTLGKELARVEGWRS